MIWWLGIGLFLVAVSLAILINKSEKKEKQRIENGEKIRTLFYFGSDSRIDKKVDELNKIKNTLSGKDINREWMKEKNGKVEEMQKTLDKYRKEDFNTQSKVKEIIIDGLNFLINDLRKNEKSEEMAKKYQEKINRIKSN